MENSHDFTASYTSYNTDEVDERDKACCKNSKRKQDEDEDLQTEQIYRDLVNKP